MTARLFLGFVLMGWSCLVACQQSAQETGPAVPSPVEEALPGSPESDPRAVEIAQRSIERMGGKENWDKVRFVSWHFMFDNRWHHWDRQTGDVRIEGPFLDVRHYLILMNLYTKQGRVWDREGQEVTDPEFDAQLTAEAVAESLKKRQPFRRVLKQTIRTARERGVLGIKVMVSGRLGGADMARREHSSEGKIPLSTLRADIDYGFTHAITTYGVIGIKVWIYRGEVIKGKREDQRHGANA